MYALLQLVLRPLLKLLRDKGLSCPLPINRKSLGFNLLNKSSFKQASVLLVKATTLGFFPFAVNETTNLFS